MLQVADETLQNLIQLIKDPIASGLLTEIKIEYAKRSTCKLIFRLEVDWLSRNKLREHLQFKFFKAIVSFDTNNNLIIYSDINDYSYHTKPRKNPK